MATEAEIAWLAGIIEGEGCINIGPRIVRITVGMTDRDVIEKIDQLFPCANGITIKNRQDPRHKTQYVWRVGKGDRVREILTLIMPWLGARRAAKATEALEFLDGRPGGNQRKTHCKQGHPFTDENTYLDAAGYKNCRTCRARWGQESAARKPAGWKWRGASRPCPVCGEEFRPTRPEQKTCGHECGATLRWRTRRASVLPSE